MDVLPKFNGAIPNTALQRGHIVHTQIFKRVAAQSEVSGIGFAVFECIGRFPRNGFASSISPIRNSLVVKEASYNRKAAADLTDARLNQRPGGCTVLCV